MKVLLIGNPNCGKSTLFNLLTKQNQTIGNWPGVTINTKEGLIDNTNINIIDLPGIYSLSYITEEEELTVKYLLYEEYDLIINVIDVTQIERSLYLTTQLLELNKPVIIGVNMIDLLIKKHIKFESNQLSLILNTPVIEISSLKAKGINELLNIINNIKYKENNNIKQIKIFPYNIERIIKLIQKNEQCNRYEAIRILEGIQINNKESIPYLYIKIKELLNESFLNTTSQIEQIYDIEQLIATKRYEFIEKNLTKCFKQNGKDKIKKNILDQIILNKWLSIPIFIIIIGMIYYIVIELIGKNSFTITHNIIQIFNEFIETLLINLNMPIWLISLISNGIIKGLGIIICFIPQLIVLYFLMSFLEKCGYMARVAFIFDRICHFFGLNGKSIIPFIIGTGCSVPGILSSRIIDNKDERNLTIICTPYIPCSAKLPVITLFTSYFFKDYSWLITTSLYLLAILIILMISLIYKKFIITTKPTSFILELPIYQWPSIKHIYNDVKDKIKGFIKKITTIILLSSIVIWFLSSFNQKIWLGLVTNPEDSLLALIGNKLAWIFYPMLGTWSWEATVAAIQGLIAKEQIIASMEILSKGTNNIFASNSPFAFFNPLNAYAYCVFCLFSIPCLSSITTLKQELHSQTKVLKVLFIQLILALILSYLIYGIGKYFIYHI